MISAKQPLTRVNELAERYGIKPYQFSTYWRQNHEEGRVCELNFSSCDTSVERKFDKMLQALGIGLEDIALQGSHEDILKTLDNALSKAPKQRGR